MVVLVFSLRTGVTVLVLLPLVVVVLVPLGCLVVLLSVLSSVDCAETRIIKNKPASSNPMFLKLFIVVDLSDQ